MSENKTAVCEVTRNPEGTEDVSLEFFGKEIKRGENKGTEYPCPKVSKDNVEQVAKWIGQDNLVGIFTAFLSKKAQGWASEATEDDGTFKKETFIELASQLSARGETIKDLLGRRDELLSDLEDIDVDGDDPEAVVAAMKIMKEIKGINGAIKSKRRKTKEDEEAEKAAESTEAVGE
jgi:hypothetical protein